MAILISSVAFAHNVCPVVGTMAAAGPMYGLAASQGLSMPQVAKVLVAGVNVYCPEKNGLLVHVPGVA